LDESGVAEVLDEPDKLGPIAHELGQPCGRESFEDFAAIGGEPGVAAIPEWRVDAQGKQCGKVTEESIAELDSFVTGIDTYVNVKPECNEASADVLEGMGEPFVTISYAVFLLMPGTEWVRACPKEAHVFVCSNLGCPRKFFTQVTVGLPHGCADVGVELAVALHELFFDGIFPLRRYAREDRFHTIGELERVCIDELEFDLYSKRERFVDGEFIWHRRMFSCCSLQRRAYRETNGSSTGQYVVEGIGCRKLSYLIRPAHRMNRILSPDFMPG